MPPRMQSFLGPSPQENLSVICISPISPGETITSRLPNELLADVFAYIAFGGGGLSGKYSHRKLLTLALVCKRWRNMAEPFLYHRLRLCSRSGSDGLASIRRLIENLENKPHVRRYPRRVDVEMYGANRVQCHLVTKVVTYCQAIRELSLHADLGRNHLSLLQSIRTLPLRRLQLTGPRNGPSLDMVFEFFDLPTLKHMVLPGWRWSKDDNFAPTWPRGDSPVSQCALDDLLPLNRHHTSNINTLDLSFPGTHPQVTDRLLSWPCRLDEVCLTYIIHSAYAKYYTASEIRRLLHIHSKSLKKIQIGIIPSGGAGIPDFSDFLLLEELHLSAYSMQRETPCNACRKLAAPSLHRLILDFGTEDQGSESARAFGASQVQWIREFLSVMTSEFPNKRLKDIYIRFCPELLFLYRGSNLIWPWDHLSEAAQVAAQYGVSLTYNTPIWSRQEWERTVAEEESDAEANASWHYSLECRL